MLTMIHFAHLLQTFLEWVFAANFLETIQARRLKFFKDREANIFKKCKSFDAAYSQLRVELHSK